MKLWNRFSQSFRDMSITVKFGLGAGLLVLLIALVAVTGYFSLQYVRSAQESMRTSREIQQLVLEMDRGMERARRLHEDFYLQYPRIGLTKAHEQYAQPSIRQIAQVITISNTLKDLIARSKVSEALQKSRVDLNLYLSSAKRFADTSIQSIELVTELAAPKRGREAQLEDHLDALQAELDKTGSLERLFSQMKSFVQDYRISRKRFLMQSAFNSAFSLREAIAGTTALEGDQAARINDLLDRFTADAERILEIDVQIKSKFNDFALQAETAGTVSATLTKLAKEELIQGLVRIRQAYRTAVILMVVITLAGLILALSTASVLNKSITRKIVRLTACAAELRKGNLEVFACEEGRDELSQLASTFNVMTARIRELVDNLEQKVYRANEALRKSEERLRLAQEAANVGTWEWDPETHEIFWSEELWKLSGLEPGSCKPSYDVWAGMVHPDDRSEAERTMRKAVLKGGRLSAEWRIKNGNGTERWLMACGQPVRDAQGQSMRYLGIVMDITERKKAEEVLEESRRQMKDIIDFLPDPTFVIDEEGTVIAWNRAIEDLTGISAAEMLGKGNYEYALPFYGERRPLLIDLVLKPREEIERGYLSLEKKNSVLTSEACMPALGEDVYMYATAGILQDSKGNIVGAIESLRDVTERRRMALAMEKRLIALTRPLDATASIGFEDLFSLEEIQKLQDQFANACGVASIITHPDGTPITKPSNFCTLCHTIIRESEKGRMNCYRSDSVIGRHNPEGPIIQPCLSGGLWDAGASITVGGRHIASWLVGQVRDETQNEDNMRSYAREIGVDEKAFIESFRQVPAMAKEQFEKVAQALFTLAGQLSSMAYQNVQQARFITERKQAEEALRASEEKFRMAFRTSPDSICLNRLSDGKYIDINEGLTKITGYSREDMVGKNFTEIDIWDDPKDRERFMGALKSAGFVENMEARFRVKGGRIRTGLISARVLRVNDEDLILSITRDITERNQAAEEKEMLKAQLHQAQKLESIGRLAGGVAHDYNNMLGVIIGYTELALLKAATSKPLHSDLEEILKAARRSTDITRQLLAFARKQTISPVVLDLNRTVEGMLKMLRRLIGEDISLAWLPASGLWPVKMDPSQIDQILANLCVNARDAIDEVGKITIETGNVTFDDSYCSEHADFVPGRFAFLTVSDDGCGMDTETVQNMFEPFFTTKDVERGTGLGLATVYGIVKQNNGFINVYSEPGRGTTIKIYLPRHAGESVEEEETQGIEPSSQGRGETILLVDDEQSILNMGKMMLEMLGYRVLKAGTPGEAIAIVRTHSGDIDLLITDVVMPEMNGRELVGRLKSLKPNLKSLFMSGYTANVIAHRGVLDEGVHFIQKPFSMNDLAQRVREALGR